MPISLEELRVTEPAQARALSFDERDELLEKILAARVATSARSPSARSG
jgi:hypothetical protein